MYAIFNSSSKEFLSYAEESLDDSYLSVLIPEDQRDLMEWRWEGNYDNGKMVKIKNSPYANVYNQKSFNAKYPLPVFMSLILKQLYILSKTNKLVDENFKQLVSEYIISFEGEEEYLNFLRKTNKI